MRVTLERTWCRHLVAAIVAGGFLAQGTPLHASDTRVDPRWRALHEESRQALSSLKPAVKLPAGGEAEGWRQLPRMIVVGFTGGLERMDSSVSGVVRLRKTIEAHVGDAPDVIALTYNNFSWRRATADVLELVQATRTASSAAGIREAARSQPIVVVYGHSWGGGAITKFARALRGEALEVSLAVYIDAFTLRQPRVPDNVRYAVNVYQRTGVFRGLPLRGKNALKTESADSTTILANLRVTPDTAHFGWNWNLVQPLLYRHHHRIGHDLRIQRYLLDLVSLAADGASPDDEPAD
jgi:hypothetical protein